MKTLQSFALLALLVGAAAFLTVGCKSPQPMPSASAGTYPLTKCVVSGEDLGDNPYVFTHNGQTVKLCCKDCLPKFDADPDKYMTKLTQAK